MLRYLILTILLSVTIPVLAQESSAYQTAIDYSNAHRADALLIYRDGELLVETYNRRYDSNEPHRLNSGTKSFTCAIAVAAIQDGLITSFDERISNTITEWQGDPQRENITLRDTLSLTSGLEGGIFGFRRADDWYAQALETDLIGTPGEQFAYGPVNFFVFGEVMQRKLSGETVTDYLDRRIFQPIGITGITFDRDNDGNPDLAGGGYGTARQWAKFGHLILNQGVWEGVPVLDSELLNECFYGTQANPNYGLSFWLGYDGQQFESTDMVRRNADIPELPADAVLGQPDIIFASGANHQLLYVIPALDMVIVRFGRRAQGWNDSEFLSLVTEG